MAQFDVYQNLNTHNNKYIPYLLNVQVDLLDVLATRVVVPLILASEIKKPVKYLNPVFKIKNVKVIMLTSELAGIPATKLGSKIASLNNHRHEIIQDLDFLWTGI